MKHKKITNFNTPHLTYIYIYRYILQTTYHKKAHIDSKHIIKLRFPHTPLINGPLKINRDTKI
jgi:hypothetical protein